MGSKVWHYPAQDLMNKQELNSLRPGDIIIHEVGKVTTRGKVISVWRDSHFTIRWQGERDTDLININDQDGKYLRRA